MRAFLILTILCLFTLPAFAGTDPAPAPELDITPLTEALGVETFAQDIAHTYESFIERTELGGTVKGKWVLTGLITLIAVILSFLARAICTRLLTWSTQLFNWLHMPYRRIRIYASVLRIALWVAIALISLHAFVYIWDIQAPYDPFSYPSFESARQIITNVFVVLAVSALVWEIINAIIQVIFLRSGGVNSNRANTVISVIRNIVFVVFAVMFALVLLPEFGINIVPLLAGAGVVGIAIGFGAQTMVKDFITGFTLIMQDVFRVGDVITIAGITGTVESITLRQVQLRGYTGVVTTIPFSTITIIQNLSRDFSAHEINIGIAYDQDTDHAFTVMERVAQSLLDDPTFSPIIIGTLEVAGVDKFADSAVMLKARLRTQPGKQWTVGREFNRRLKKAFDSENIEIPFPQQVSWQRQLS